MLKKKLLLVTIILFLSSCGYTPMWKGINSNDVNFTIQIVESKGNDNLNRLINANLKKYNTKTWLENYSKILIAINPIVPHLSSECLELIKKKRYQPMAIL